MYFIRLVIRTLLISNLLITFQQLLSPATAKAADPQVQLLATGSLVGTSRDLSGLSGVLETETHADQLGGFSAIEYSGEHDRYFVLSDRGPGDGAASFSCRYHEFELHINASQHRIDASLVKTVLLKSADNKGLSGSLAALSLESKADGLLAFDCEGIRVTRESQFVITDEYGPSVSLFGADGRRVSRFEVPAEFLLCQEPQAANARGTFPNRGLEGIAVIPSSGDLVAAMQGPLIQDGAVVDGKCLGLNTRWLHIDGKNKQIRQYVYPLVDDSSGVSEVLAIDEHQFLVLERDSSAGLEARIKRIYLADIENATDVSRQDRLGRDDLPASIKAMKKSLLIDLLDERWGLAGENAPEKPEGITWGPQLPDGRQLLIVCTDNDFENERTSDFYAFAISL